MTIKERPLSDQERESFYSAPGDEGPSAGVPGHDPDSWPKRPDVISRKQSTQDIIKTKHLTVDYADGMEVVNETDGDGNPAGGGVDGCGIWINWQNGPLDREAKLPPDGAFIEDVVYAIILRLEFYQNSKFVCDENAVALNHMRLALSAMLRRRDDRLKRGVLGKHEQ